jgi:acylphosphatase
MDRVRVVVEGRVQGVGFRAFVLREARVLGLGGAVWNRTDGAVELEAEGDRMRLEELVETLRRGSRAAAVTGITTEWSEGPSRHAGFSITSTRPR